MKNKYRVVQIGDKFYPEKRYWFLCWSRFEEKIVDYSYLTMDVYRKSLEEANDVIRQYILKDKFAKIAKKNIKIHPFYETKNP